MVRNLELSIVICTRNRSFILPDCFESLLSQTNSMTKIEIIVVDNGSVDTTVEVIKNYSAKFHFFKYKWEPEIGLGQARNSGVEEAIAPWILFLDDDAKAAPDLIARIIDIINYCDFDCFGGRYLAWFKFGKPKWLAEKYGTMPKLLEAQGYIEQPNLAGGIMVVKRLILEKLGGFSTSLGMTEQVGYGEDSDIQLRMLRKGYKLGFDPDLLIHHCVLPHKFDVRWHLKAAKAKGRDQVNFQSNEKIILFQLVGELIISLSIRLPYALFRLALKEDYFWQNLVLSVSSRFLYSMGKYQNATIRKTSPD